MIDDGRDQGAVFRIYRIGRLFDLLSLLPPAAVAIVLIIYGTDALKSFAGANTDTKISFAIRYITSKESAFGIPWFLSLGLYIWAKIERKLRKKTVATMSGHIKELELRLDPQRTSSELTHEGDTNPDDKGV